MAKATAGRAAPMRQGRLQIHGGIGYTWEHDLHLYLRRAYASEHLLGTHDWHHDRLADLILGERPRGVASGEIMTRSSGTPVDQGDAVRGRGAAGLRRCEGG